MVTLYFPPVSKIQKSEYWSWVMVCGGGGGWPPPPQLPSPITSCAIGFSFLNSSIHPRHFRNPPLMVAAVQIKPQISRDFKSFRLQFLALFADAVIQVFHLVKCRLHDLPCRPSPPWLKR